MGPGGASGTVDHTTSPWDVYAVYLSAGQLVHFGGTRADYHYVSLTLYVPGTKTVPDFYSSVAGCNDIRQGFNYTPAVSGVYYLGVYAQTNGDVYTVTVSGTETMPQSPVYRFRNLKNGYYLWSADENEKATIIATLSGTWKYEGVAYQINTVNPLNSSTLWRFRNMRGGFYLYSADPGEKSNIINTLGGTWVCEGPAYSVSVNSSGAPVWRFRNLHDGTYLYSADPNEKNTIVATLGSTWLLEGVAYYVAP